MKTFHNPKLLSYVILSMIVFIVIKIYAPIINYEFVGFNHERPVNQISEIKQESLLDVGKVFFNHIFKTDAPLAKASLALDYYIGRDNPAIYHAHNLLLYLLCIIVLFLFIQTLFKSYGFSIAVVALFAILATHVEIVVWISQRKYLLYFLFFFATLIAYLKYQETAHKKTILFILTLFLFLLSFFAYGNAWALLATIILIDFCKKRTLNRPIIFEKIPFVIIVLLLSLLSHSSNIIEKTTEVNEVQQIIFPQSYYSFKNAFIVASYAFFYYFVSFFHPKSICFANSHPQFINNLLPYQYYMSFFALLIFVFLAIVYFVNKRSDNKRRYLFGFLFFTVNIGLYLNYFSPMSGFVVANRHSFVAYVGLSIVLASVLQYLFKRKDNRSRFLLFIVVLLFYLGIFAHHAITKTNYINIWQNSQTLFGHLISENKNLVFAYNNRGVYHFNNKSYGKAIGDFTHAINSISDRDKEHITTVYSNRSIAYLKTGNYLKAISDIQYILNINPHDTLAQKKLEMCYKYAITHNDSLIYINKRLVNSPTDDELWVKRGRLKSRLGLLQFALDDFNAAVELQPNKAETYNYRGLLHWDLNDFNNAIYDFEKAMELDNQYPEPIYNLAHMLCTQKRFTKAFINFDKALAIDSNNSKIYMYRANCYLEIKNIDKACFDWTKAKTLGAQKAQKMLETYCP